MPRPSPPASPLSGARSEGYAKSRETKALLLDAALAEATERGLHNMSVAGIAARANTAIGSVHYHFGSRSRLVSELMQKLISDLQERFAEIDATPGTDFFTRLRSELLAYMEYLRAHPAHLRLADEIKFLDPKLYTRGVEAWVARLAEKIRAGIEEGSLRPMDDVEITAQAHFLIGARNYVEEMITANNGLGDEAVVDAYLGLVGHGIACKALKARTSMPSAEGGKGTHD